jgi:hypothetical protein
MNKRKREKTLQQVFNHVARHMLKQNCRAIYKDTVQCMYRGTGGTMCAAGCLIADKYYKPEFEGWSIKGLGVHAGKCDAVWYAVMASGVPNEARDLVQALQKVHDGGDGGPESWPGRLREVACNFGLQYREAWVRP